VRGIMGRRGTFCRLVFGALLYTLPPAFRRRFGMEMTQALVASLRQQRSAFRRVSVLASAVADLLAGILPLWLDRARGELVAGRPATRSYAPRSPRQPIGLGSLHQDVGYAFRTLRKRPLLTAVAITTLGLSVGAPTAMFSVINGVLLRPLPYRDPGQLVEVWQVFPHWREREGLSQHWQNLGVSYPQFLDWRRDQTAFESVAVFHASEWSQMTLTGDGLARRLSVGIASSTLLPTLGVEPVLGRGFRAEEEAPAGERSDRVALIAHGFWISHFGSDPGVLGKSLTLDGEIFVVVGVLPAGFRLRSMNHVGDRDLQGSQDLWILPGAGHVTTGRSSNTYDAIGRIRPGVAIEVAEADVQASMFQGAAPTERTSRIVRRTREEVTGLRSPLLILLGATGVLLLIGCVNTATLSLSELSGRRQELTTRWALGAGKWRIVRQLLTESALLGALGSLLGMLLAWVGTRALVAMAPPLPRLHEISVDARVLAFAGAVGLLAGLLFGTVPAVFSTQGRASALSTRAPTRLDASGGRLQRWLVSIEVALTVVLLVTGGLLVRSLFALRSVDPGFSAQGLATVRISIPDDLIQTVAQDLGPLDQESERAGVAEARASLLDELLRRIRGLPGVTEVAAADALPFPGDRISSSTVRIGGRTAPEARLDPDRVRVSPGFHEAMGIPLLAGRSFAVSDRWDTPAVAIISESFASRYWPDGSPLGATIGDFGEPPKTIVGVVGDVRVGSLSRLPRPTFYLPLAQSGTPDLNLLVRGEGEIGALAGQMRRVVQGVNPAIPVSEDGALPALVAQSAREEQYRATLMSVFAGLATILAAVGIFGVAARVVTQRSRELGIRMAVGATHARLMSHVIRGSLIAGLSGATVGLLAAFWTSQLVTEFLFGVDKGDALTYGLVGAFVACLCLLASYVPAKRITRIDPVGVLKEE